MMTRSYGTTKQSPVPQHHSPAAWRWPPGEIQLSWAEVMGTTRTKLAITSTSRARLPNMSPSLSLFRPGHSSNDAHSPWFPDGAGCRRELRTRHVVTALQSQVCDSGSESTL